MVISVVANSCMKRTPAIKLHHPTCQTPEMRKIATHKFFYFYNKKRDLTNLFDQFHSTVVFYFVLFVQSLLHSSEFFKFVSCNLCLWYYDQLVLFNKEINANVYRHSFWECSKRFNRLFEWRQTPHMTLSIETCIGRTPCIKRTLKHSPKVSA